MRAGSTLESGSVSPWEKVILANEAEEIDVEEGVDGERLELDKEEDYVRKLKDPKLPSQAEVEKHWSMAHCPYRDWCPVCVQARGRDMGHMADKGDERRVPEYHWDYCFPGDELGFKWTVLVGKERQTKMFMATAVPTKGGTGKFALDKCLEFVEENGDQEADIIVKTDQENSVMFMIKELLEARSVGKTMVEEAPRQSKGSNGVVERAVPEIEGGIKSLFLTGSVE